jgi:hypothetical protein
VRISRSCAGWFATLLERVAQHPNRASLELEEFPEHIFG